MTEFGNGFQIPVNATFGKSQMWSFETRRPALDYRWLQRWRRLVLRFFVYIHESSLLPAATSGSPTSTSTSANFGCQEGEAGSPCFGAAARGKPAFAASRSFLFKCGPTSSAAVASGTPTSTSGGARGKSSFPAPILRCSKSPTTRRPRRRKKKKPRKKQEKESNVQMNSSRQT